MIDDNEIEDHRLAGEITLVLQNGPPAERESLLRAIASMHGEARAREMDGWYPSLLPTAPPRCCICNWHHLSDVPCP